MLVGGSKRRRSSSVRTSRWMRILTLSKCPAWGVSPESSWLTGQSSVAPDGLCILASTRPRAPFSCTAKEASWPALRAFSCGKTRKSYTTTTTDLSGEPEGGGTTCRLAMVRRRASSDSVATGTMKGESGTCSSLNLMETS